MAAKKRTFDADVAWNKATTYAKEKLDTDMNTLISRRNKGDKEAQAQINEAYGKRSGGDDSMSVEGRRHLTEAVRTSKLKKALSNTGEAVNEVRLGGEDAMRDLAEYKKKGKNKKSMWAGE